MVERTRTLVTSLLIPPRGRHSRSRRKVRLRPIQALVALLVVAGGLTTAFVSASGANAGGFTYGSGGQFGYGHKHHPVITTSSSITDPGDSLTVNCKNFAPNEKITFTLDSHPVFLGKTTSNGNGSCSIQRNDPLKHQAGRTHDRRHRRNRRLGVHRDHRRGPPSST